MIVTSYARDYSISADEFRSFVTDKQFIKNMNLSLPDYYANGEDILTMQQIAWKALNEIEYKVAKVPELTIPSNATARTIDDWEIRYELITDKTKPLDIREKIVILHYFFIFNDTTITTLTKSFQIIGISGRILMNYGISVTLELNTSSDLEDMLRIVYRRAVPAHLDLIFSFGSTWQAILDTGTWNEQLSRTWGDNIF